MWRLSVRVARECACVLCACGVCLCVRTCANVVGMARERACGA